MGSSWYFEETGISSDDPGQSSPDSMSFNGTLFNYSVGSLTRNAGDGCFQLNTNQLLYLKFTFNSKFELSPTISNNNFKFVMKPKEL